MPATPANITAAIQKFDQYKHSELVVGRSVQVGDPLFDDPAELTATILATFEQLLPIYDQVMNNR